MVEGARLESVCRGNSTEGSNPSLSASLRSPSASFDRVTRRATPSRKRIDLRSVSRDATTPLDIVHNVQYMIGPDGRLPR